MGYVIQRSKTANFNRTEAGLTSKWDKNYQQFNVAIRSSLSAPYKDVRCHASLKTLIFFFFNPSPSSCRAVGVTDLETVKGFLLFLPFSFIQSFIFIMIF